MSVSSPMSAERLPSERCARYNKREFEAFAARKLAELREQAPPAVRRLPARRARARPMSATREHRNLGAIEDAVAAIGAVITTTEHLLGALAGQLPDDTSEGEIHLALGSVRDAHNELGAVSASERTSATCGVRDRASNVTGR